MSALIGASALFPVLSLCHKQRLEYDRAKLILVGILSG